MVADGGPRGWQHGRDYRAVAFPLPEENEVVLPGRRRGAPDDEATLDELAVRRDTALHEYRLAVAQLRGQVGNSDADRDRYERAVTRLFVDELTHPDLVAIARDGRQPLVQADSFWHSIVVRRRKKQLGTVPEKHLGIDKDHDRRFVELLGVSTPEVRFTGSFHAIPATELTNVVVKPVDASDSRGAFYVFGPDDIFGIARSERLASWEALARSAAEQLGPDAVERSTWRIEELVEDGDGRPARDLKFYTFYGHVGLVLEVSRYPVREYAHFDEDLLPVDPGFEHEPRFRDPTQTTVDRGALTPQMLDLVRRVSLSIPVPFMRIDFLKSSYTLTFVEFSSAPGMSHTLTGEYDRRLGQAYHQAEIRLVDDLLAGKRFDAFAEFIAEPKTAR